MQNVFSKYAFVASAQRVHLLGNLNEQNKSHFRKNVFIGIVFLCNHNLHCYQ